MKMDRKSKAEHTPVKVKTNNLEPDQAVRHVRIAESKAMEGRVPVLEMTNERILPGGGEMGERIRAFDWSKTPLGPINIWSPALLILVRIILANRFPLLLWWGPQYISIYNDAYIPILGKKHPWALGQPVSECWKEIWHILQPLIDTPFKGGPATWDDDISLEINRHGFMEETHFTIAYSPVPDETISSGIGGVLATVHEITGKVVGERRIVTLRDLGASVGEAKTAEEACAIAAESLTGRDKDIPFALLYLIDAAGKQARLAGAVGVQTNEEFSPLIVDLDAAQESGWPLVAAGKTEAMQVVERLEERFTKIPPGPWFDPPHTAVVVPISSNNAHKPAGLMIVGVSSRLKFDQLYQDFFELVRTKVATAIANARVYEEERRRAEALEEIDRAKTAFFSNVSHEFRTPLTLMLGPLEDMLAQNNVAPSDRERLEVTHRNSMRLLKLVNTLLDFSRLEAGRLEPNYEPTDLGAYTAELASVFRSAIEQARMKLIVNCPLLAELVYVDREMWEKIILNLLSNAFKFTFEGEIEVSLQWANEAVVLTVSDTGVGIPENELPHMFERFHRIRGARARTHEGTGIGLALVRELVHLHGGNIQVTSLENKGTTFTISIPTGRSHLPSERIGVVRTMTSTALGAEPYGEEVLSWLPEDNGHLSMDHGGWSITSERLPAVNGAKQQTTPSGKSRILLADDNTDMRRYIQRLLEHSDYEVESVADGLAALHAARERPPDLVLTDVMMPGLDGFGLLRELREGEGTATIPVIMLSARAGEESRVEGMEAGADDYLVKPFSARELLARVRAHLEIARIREQAEQALRQVNLDLESRVQDRTTKLQSVNQSLVEEILERKRVEEELRLNRDRLRELSQRLVEVQEDERRTLARELHDRAGQTLAALNINLIIMRGQFSEDVMQRVGARMNDALQLVNETITLVRDVMADLRPAELDDYGLEVAVRTYLDQYSSRYGTHVLFEKPETPLPRLDPSKEMTFLRVIQGAFTNIARHAHASQVNVSLSSMDGIVHLTVQDNGVGMELQEANHSGSHGLKIMRERVEAFGGDFTVTSIPAKGTKVEARMPIGVSRQGNV